MSSKCLLIVFSLVIVHSMAELSLQELFDIFSQSYSQDEKTETILQSKESNKGCGWRNNDGNSLRISDDGLAKFGEFPWVINIHRRMEVNGQKFNVYQCGGSLIAPNVVLTAAHKVYMLKPHELNARGGVWNIKNENQDTNYVDKPVKEIIFHENFNNRNYFNDIALLILEEPFDWQQNIYPICLPDRNANSDHSRCYATGWGKDKIGSDGKYNTILKKIELLAVPHATCQSQLRSTLLGPFFRLNESFMCAGGEKNKDTCVGDGGSPLVCPIPDDNSRYYQAGIVAWGIGCGDENVPGVYANVAYLRPWISEKLAARGIRFDHFTP